METRRTQETQVVRSRPRMNFMYGQERPTTIETPGEEHGGSVSGANSLPTGSIVRRTTPPPVSTLARDRVVPAPSASTLTVARTRPEVNVTEAGQRSTPVPTSTTVLERSRPETSTASAPVGRVRPTPTTVSSSSQERPVPGVTETEYTPQPYPNRPPRVPNRPLRVSDLG